MNWHYTPEENYTDYVSAIYCTYLMSSDLLGYPDELDVKGVSPFIKTMLHFDFACMGGCNIDREIKGFFPYDWAALWLGHDLERGNKAGSRIRGFEDLDLPGFLESFEPES